MRLKLKFSLKSKIITKDYRSSMVSFFKYCLENNNKLYLEKYFSEDSIIKNYTWGVYFGKIKFLSREIEIEDKKIILNFSTSSSEEGIIFFNSFMGQIGKEYPFGKENFIKLEDIKMVPEKNIEQNYSEFKTLSHILVKERLEGSNRDNYFTFLDEKWEEVLKRNLKFQLKDRFEFDPSHDIDSLKIFIDKNLTKRTVVTNYNISFPVTYGKIRLEGEKYLLDYFYKSGIGSKRSLGFGCLEKL
ncbi:MAG: CRISPR-associated endoribonuclease Cas6 [Fusobacteriaceae bacterium]